VLGLGLVLALFASRFMTELLFDTSYRDAGTFAGSMIVLLVAVVFFPRRERFARSLPRPRLATEAQRSDRRRATRLPEAPWL